MKKYLFLSIIIVLFPLSVFAQPFLVTAVKAGSGTPGIPIDTIRPGINFGIRVADVGAGSAPVYIWPARLDSLGVWAYDTLDKLSPSTIQLAGGIGTVDDAFFRTSVITTNANNFWIRIVVGLSAPPAAGQDSSRPLCVMLTPSSSDSGDNYTITADPNPMGARGPTLITIYTPGDGKSRTYDVKIVDAFGYVVRNLIKDGPGDASGRYVFVTWDGRNGKGTKASNGAYQICVKAKEGTTQTIWRKKIGVVW